MTQSLLTEYAEPDRIVYVYYCWRCEGRFRSTELQPDCRDCGAKVVQPCGFVGAAELARRVEEIADDVPEHIDLTRLNYWTAKEVLARYG